MSRGFAAVAVAAADFALLHLLINGFPTATTIDQIADGVEFFASDMIEFQNYRIHLSAINTRVVCQKSDDLPDNLCFCGPSSPDRVGYMARLVVLIPSVLSYPFAIATLRLPTIPTRRIQAEFIKALRGSTRRTPFRSIHRLRFLRWQPDH